MGPLSFHSSKTRMLECPIVMEHTESRQNNTVNLSCFLAFAMTSQIWMRKEKKFNNKFVIEIEPFF